MNNTATLFWNDYDCFARSLQERGLSSCIVEYRLYKRYEVDEQRLHYYYLLTEDKVVVDLSVDHDGNTTIFEVYDSLHDRMINSVFKTNIASKLSA